MKIRETVFYLVLLIFIIFGSYLIPISRIVFATPYVYRPETMNTTGLYPSDPRFNIEVAVVGELVIMRVNVSDQGGAKISHVYMNLTAGNGTIINNTVQMTNTTRGCAGTATCVIYESNYTLKGTPYADPGGNWLVNVSVNDTNNVRRNNNTQFNIDFNLTRTDSTVISDVRGKASQFGIQTIGSAIINSIFSKFRSLDIAVSNSFSMSSVFSKILDLIRQFLGMFTIQEISMRLSDLTKSIASMFTFLDYLASFPTRMQEISNIITLDSLAYRLADLSRRLTNTLSFVDLISSFRIRIESLTDTITFTAISSNLYNYLKQLTNIFTFTDSVSRLFQLSRQFTNMFTFTDLFGTFKLKIIAVTDTFSFSSVYSRLMAFLRSFVALFTITSNISYGTYNITVWIDGKDTLAFQNCTQPVNVTVKVTKWGSNLNGAIVQLKERSGAHLFTAPQSGATVFGMANITTDANGVASLTIIPTGYQAPSSYNISVEVIENDVKVLTRYMSLTDASLVTASKSITVPNENELSSTLSSLIKIKSKASDWMNQQKGYSYSVNITPTGGWNMSNSTIYVDVPSTFKLYAYDTDSATANVRFVFKEGNGTMMFAASQAGAATFGYGNITTNSSGMAVITIIPTGYQPAYNYNMTLEAFDENGDYLNTTTFTINTGTLNDYGAGGATSIENYNDISSALSIVIKILDKAVGWVNA